MALTAGIGKVFGTVVRVARQITENKARRWHIATRTLSSRPRFLRREPGRLRCTSFDPGDSTHRQIVLGEARRLRHTEGESMSATDPIVTFVLILAIGIVAGILFDRLAGPSWLARQFAGSTRGIVTSALVGVAGAFVAYHIAVLLALGGGLVTSVIAAAAGAALVLFAWRLAK